MTDLAAIFDGIRATHGALTAPLVVAEAAAPDHPLHHRFEWDDTVAGRRYREVQAAQLIRSVKVTYAQTRDGQDKTVRRYWPTKREADDDLGVRSSYEPVVDIVADPFARGLLLRQMERDWRRFKARYGHLEEFARTVAAADEAQPA